VRLEARGEHWIAGQFDGSIRIPIAPIVRRNFVYKEGQKKNGQTSYAALIHE
jgi:hypothetical protein